MPTPKLKIPKISPKLPPEAFVYLPANEPHNSVGLVKRGESGYYPVEAMVTSALSTPDEARALVKKLNEAKGVTPLQAQCMSVGSMFGWHVPGADPDKTTLSPQD